MYSIILFILCLMLLAISLYFNKDSIMSPSNLIVFSFTVAVLCGLLNYDNWNFHVSSNTCFLVFGGLASFMLAATLCKYIWFRAVQTEPRKRTRILSLPLPIYIVGIAYPLFVMLRTSRELMSVVQTYGGGADNVMDAIGKYDQLIKFSGQAVGLSSLTDNMNALAQALMYYWLFRLLKTYFDAKKIDAWAFVALVVSLPVPLLSGSRNGLYQELVAIIVIGLLYYTAYAGHKIYISFKAGMVSAIVVLVLLFSFKPLLSLLGRKDSLNTFDYISLYLGAPVKNLDTYLKGYTVPAPNRWGEMTFANMRSNFSFIFGDSVPDWNIWQPFQTVNGRSLGNVYTIFYPLVYDFGFIGAIVMMMALGTAAQLVFEYARKTLAEHRSGFPIATCIYGIVAYGLVFSFFSNRLIATVFSAQFVKFLMVWVLIGMVYRIRLNGFKKPYPLTLRLPMCKHIMEDE